MTPASLLPDLAYSDASLQPYSNSGVIAAVLPHRTLTKAVTVRSLSEAELLAAELAVLHATPHHELLLRLDCPNAARALSGEARVKHRDVAARILGLAAARGITLQVQQIPSGENRAHEPALRALRDGDQRRRLDVTLHTQGGRVRVRAKGMTFDGHYPVPPTLHALLELARRLPPQTVARVHGLAPLAQRYWFAPKQAPVEVRRLVVEAQRMLGRKRSEVRPVKDREGPT